MKNLPFLSFIMVFALAVPLSSRAQTAGTLPGQLYIAGVKGDSTAQTGQRLVDLKPNTQFVARGLVIETKPHAEDTLVLSNGTAMFIGNDSRLDVNHFQQQKFNGNSYPPEGEPSISTSSFSIPRGFVGVCAGNQAAGSSMSFTTPLASVAMHGGMVAIQSNDNETIVYALKKDATINTGPNNPAGSVLPQGQKAVITRNPDGSAGPVLISPIDGRQALALNTSVGMACEARKLVLFDSLGQAQVVKPGEKPNTSDSGKKEDEVQAQAVLPKDLPIQQTVSPASIPPSS